MHSPTHKGASSDPSPSKEQAQKTILAIPQRSMRKKHQSTRKKPTSCAPIVPRPTIWLSSVPSQPAIQTRSLSLSPGAIDQDTKLPCVGITRCKADRAASEFLQAPRCIKTHSLRTLASSEAKVTCHPSSEELRRREVQVPSTQSCGLH